MSPRYSRGRGAHLLSALAHRLADPEAIPALITMLPDPQAVAFLQALAPGIAAMHRRLTRLEALLGALCRARSRDDRNLLLEQPRPAALSVRAIFADGTSHRPSGTQPPTRRGRLG
jgi:hypothetical protein